MTIGKRKGYTSKGSGAEIGSPGAASKEVGGSLSKNDHWYLQQAFGMPFDPGAAAMPGIEATGGDIQDYQNPAVLDPASGQAQWYRSHTFRTSGSFVVSAPGMRGGNIDYVIVAGGGGGGNCYGSPHNGAGGGGGGAGGQGGFDVSKANGTYHITIGDAGAEKKRANKTT